MIKIYADFFKKCLKRKEPNIIIQGSSNAGKTYNVLEFIDTLSLLNYDFKETQNVVTSRSIDHLRKGAFSYLKKISNTRRIKSPMTFYYPTELNFKTFENEEEATGIYWGMSYFNECNHLDFKIVNQVQARTKRFSIFDFNPSKEFWINELINENNFLKTTWRDNPYLEQKQIDFFESIKARAERTNATVYDRWYYKVFYLGEYGNLQGNVFSSVTQISEKEHGAQTQTFSKIYGLDFGFSNDPCALVEVAKHGNKLFLKQLYYSNQTNDFQLAEIIKQKCEKRFPIVYDTGGGGDVRANHLRLLTKNFFEKKRSAEIEHGIAMIQGLDIYICGEETFKEFKGYEYKDGKFTETNNHSIDAVRYAYEYGVRSGRIKV